MNVLAIYAHPDDAEFLASGTMAKWAAGGHEVYAIAATDGSMGTKTLGRTRSQMAKQRKNELTKAMSVIGGHPPLGFWFPDGSLEKHRDELRERLAYWIRKLKANRILTLDPWLKYEIHPDHITVGRIASEAAVFTCFPLYFPDQIEQGLEPHQPREVWYMAPTERAPNRIVDISGTFEKKIESLLSHESQIEMLADWFVPSADPTNLTVQERAELSSGVRRFLEMMARGIGSKHQVELAEAFYAVRCGPGHFEMAREMMSEMLEKMREDVEVL
jgi:LmbE family N-acetylglucosaminyl deacetylase